jgi:hypothetical protein
MCVGSNAPSGVGDVGTAGNQICGAILVFVGPSAGADRHRDRTDDHRLHHRRADHGHAWDPSG